MKTTSFKTAIALFSLLGLMGKLEAQKKMILIIPD